MCATCGFLMPVNQYSAKPSTNSGNTNSGQKSASANKVQKGGFWKQFFGIESPDDNTNNTDTTAEKAALS
jgi:hypothetical protein